MKVISDRRSEFPILSNWNEEAWKKIRASTGFEPVTSAIPVRCSTNWAMKPHIGSEVNCEFLFSRERSEMTYSIWNDSYKNLYKNLYESFHILYVKTNIII